MDQPLCFYEWARSMWLEVKMRSIRVYWQAFKPLGASFQQVLFIIIISGSIT